MRVFAYEVASSTYKSSKNLSGNLEYVSSYFKKMMANGAVQQNRPATYTKNYSEKLENYSALQRWSFVSTHQNLKTFNVHQKFQHVEASALCQLGYEYNLI